MRFWIRMVVLACVALASLALIVLGEGLTRALGFLLNTALLATILVLDRRSPDWRSRGL